MLRFVTDESSVIWQLISSSIFGKSLFIWLLQRYLLDNHIHFNGDSIYILAILIIIPSIHFLGKLSFRLNLVELTNDTTHVFVTVPFALSTLNVFLLLIEDKIFVVNSSFLIACYIWSCNMLKSTWNYRYPLTICSVWALYRLESCLDNNLFADCNCHLYYLIAIVLPLLPRLRVPRYVKLSNIGNSEMENFVVHLLVFSPSIFS